MLMIIFSFLLAFATLLFVSLLKIYTHVPKAELKRRARAGDDFAKLLYSAAAYGTSAQVLLWFFIGLSAAGFFVLASASLPSWIALILAVVLVWLGFAWLPNTRVGFAGRLIAKYITPPFTWLLAKLYPILDKIGIMLMRHARIRVHTGIYEKADIIDLLKRQKKQPDNRLTDSELQTIEGALTYGDKLVRDTMVPWRMVKSIAATEPVGPLLMDELHSSGHSRFPVYQDKPANVVGMLYVRDLIKHSTGGKVKDVMKKRVLYAHEDQNLGQVLQAFIKTRHHLFIVVNSFEEKVGIITLEDVMEQVIGKPVMDEFDKYDDLRAVATITAQKEHEKHELKIETEKV